MKSQNEKLAQNTLKTYETLLEFSLRSVWNNKGSTQKKSTGHPLQEGRTMKEKKKVDKKRKMDWELSGRWLCEYMCVF